MSGKKASTAAGPRSLAGLSALPLLAGAVLAGPHLSLAGQGGFARQVQPKASKPKFADSYIFYFIIDGGSGLRIERGLKPATEADAGPEAPEALAPFDNIREFFVDKGINIPLAVTVWPSSSLPGHVASMTGAYPATSCIGGQRGFRRNRPDLLSRLMLDSVTHQPIKRADYFFRSYIGPEYLALNQSDLCEDVGTLYEHFSAPNVRQPNGIQMPQKNEICTVDVTEQTYRGASNAAYPSTTDEGAIDRAMGRVREFASRCRIFAINLPDLDHHTHRLLLDSSEGAAPQEERADAVLQRTDKLIGRFLGRLQADQDAHRNRIFQNSVFVLTADHGMGAVSHHFDLPNQLRDTQTVTVARPTMLKTDEALVAANAYVKQMQKFLDQLGVGNLAKQMLGGFYNDRPDGKEGKFSEMPGGLFEIELKVDSRGTWKFKNEQDYDQYQSYALFGGNSDGMIYLQGIRRDAQGKILGSSWSIPVSNADIKAYPLLKADKSGSKPPVNLPRLLLGLEQDSKHPVAFVFYPGARENTFTVEAREGESEITVRPTTTTLATPSASQFNYCYRVVRGSDPLGYLSEIDYLQSINRREIQVSAYHAPDEPLPPSIPSDERSLLQKKASASPKGEICASSHWWLEHTARAWYPDALQRIAMAFGNRRGAHGGPGWHEGSPMSPDIGLNPIPGWDFLSTDDSQRGYKGDLGPMPKRLEGSHGGLDYTHSLVPVLISSPNPAIQALLKSSRARVARTVDVLPTLLDLFDRTPLAGRKIDGESLLKVIQ